MENDKDLQRLAQANIESFLSYFREDDYLCAAHSTCFTFDNILIYMKMLRDQREQGK